MPQSFRLATFNLENLDDRPRADPPLEQRLSVLRPQLERLNADVLCLQEVNGQRDTKGAPRCLRALDTLLRGTPYETFARATVPRGITDKHNPVILSRWPIAACHGYHHDLVPPPSVRLVTAEPPDPDTAPLTVTWDRPTLHAEIGLPGGHRLHVLNLHLRAPLAAVVPGQKQSAATWRSVAGWAEGFYLAAIKRAGQALETRLAVERLFDHDPAALIVVAGDYNAEARETPVRLIRGDPGDTGTARLASRALEPLEATLPAARRYSVLHDGEPLLLDHLLVSRALRLWFRRAEIHNETLDDEVEAERRTPHAPESHHAPVVAEFSLPE